MKGSIEKILFAINFVTKATKSIKHKILQIKEDKLNALMYTLQGNAVPYTYVNGFVLLSAKPPSLATCRIAFHIKYYRNRHCKLHENRKTKDTRGSPYTPCIFQHESRLKR